MKPLKIEMEAFGSYGKKTIIDFTKPQQNLFLVSGSTGSGKTTIFDAIVFALYGEASSNSNKKTGEILQSQYASYDVEPYVQLSFKEKNKIYTVKRYPQHWEFLKTGKGKGTELCKNPKAEKIELTLPGDIPYNGKNNEINKKIKELIGLEKEQFMKIGMLAQGEFMDVLRTDSGKKREIFRTLFNTEIYNDIGIELKRRLDDKQECAKEFLKEAQREIERLHIPEYAEDLIERKQVFKGDINSVDWSQLQDFVEEVDKQIAIEMKNLEEIKESCDKQQKSRDKKQAEITVAKKDLEVFEEFEEVKQALEKYNDISLEDRKKLKKNIEVAYKLKKLDENYSKKKADLENVKNKIKELEKKIPILEKNSAELKVYKESKEQEYDKFIKEKGDKSAKLNADLEKFKKLEEEKKNYQDAKVKHDEAKSFCSNAEENLKTCEQQIEENNVELEKLKNLEVDSKLIENEKISLKNKKNTFKRLKEVEKAESDLKIELSQKKEERDIAFNEYDKAKKRYDVYYNLFISNQKASLAEKLIEGTPCPVCGSLHHPTPFKPENNEKVNGVELDLRKKKTDEAYEIWNAMEITIKNIEKEQLPSKENEKKRILQELLDYLNILSAENSLEIERNLNKKEDDINKAERANFENKQKQAVLEEYKKKLNDKQEEYKVLLAKVNEDREKASTKYEIAKEKFMTLGKELENFGTEDEIREELKKLKDKEERLNNSKTQAIKNFNKEQDELNYHKDRLGFRRKEDLPRCEYENDEAYKSFVEEIKNNPIENWRDICLSYEETSIVDMQKKIDMHRNSLIIKNTKEEAIKAKKRPNIDEVIKVFDEAENRLKEISQKKTDKERLIRDLEEPLKKITRNHKERKKAIHDRNVYQKLYNIIMGKKTGERMQLETFVQRYYLERILAYANKRFYDMTAGQYELRMMDIEAASSGKDKGLDLLVYSNVTGKERAVESLSGGESFMAALALALGMSDEIQSQTSSINMDVMFIDEGFGSLDNQSREAAVKVLKEMAGGNKLIGIISHVTQLSQEIEEKLIVRKDSDGSHVEWELS